MNYFFHQNKKLIMSLSSYPLKAKPMMLCREWYCKGFYCEIFVLYSLRSKRGKIVCYTGTTEIIERERERERERDGMEVFLQGCSYIFSHGCSRMHRCGLKHLIQSSHVKRVELLCLYFLCQRHICSCCTALALHLSPVFLLKLSPFLYSIQTNFSI